MMPHTPPLLTRSFHAHPFASVAGLTSAFVGAWVLTGWILDLEIFKRVLPGLSSMNAGSALGFVLLGVALWLTTLKKPARHSLLLARTAALLIGLIAGATLAEFALGRELSIDRFVSEELHLPSLDSPAARWMSAATTFSFLLLAVTVFLLSSSSTLARRVIQAMVLTSLLLAAVALIEYAYGFESLYNLAPNMSMTAHTAITFFVLSVGMLYARPDFGVMTPIRSPGMGGLLARKMLPAVLGIPLLLGWVRLVESRQLGENGYEIGLTIHTITMIVVFAVLVWLTARSMNEIDAQREIARKAEREMRVLSEIDPLTGILNRRSFTERGEHEWSRSTRYAIPLSAIMFDIDFFKQINDRCGHAAGDAILQGVADLLREECRPSDLAFRYGGDEFCVLASDTDESGAAHLADRLCTMLAARQIQVQGHTLGVTGSFGVAQRSIEMNVVADLIAAADQALMAAKQSGRDGVVRASWSTACVS
jgi:diguanylate cyclase (GGDEF)-like protein